MNDWGRDLSLEPTAKRPPARVAGVAVSVVVLSGPERGTSVPVRSRVRIGKASDNELTLTDQAVSRRHCEILRAADGLRVRDLGSTNGTFVDGVRVADAIVPVGSVLHAGCIELALRPNPPGAEVLPYDAVEFEGVIGHSLAMRRVFRILDVVAKTNATVLLQGETGTGKEVLARALAKRSRRAEPYVVVDCSAVNPTLISSELFGHERGAFTGAVSQRKGAFENATGGTVFLDELSELPLDLQPMLLRVLEAREFRRVGGNRVLNADVRIVAASSRDLEREVNAGRFRQDLFFRLSVVPIRVPPLRMRREDIPPLVQHFLSQHKGAQRFRLSERTMGWLMNYDWPGNVRELRNLLERALCMSAATASKEPFLPAVFTGRNDPREEFCYSPNESYRQTRSRFDEEFERCYVASLLAEYEGNISLAARAAKMDRKHLGTLVRKHSLRDSPGSPR